MKDKIVKTLHQPEHTGENRCGACTIVNTLIAGIVSSVLARRSWTSGGIFFILSIAAIYLRGYLVPGTPRLTKRYLPSTVLEWFGKGSMDQQSMGGLAGPQQTGGLNRNGGIEHTARESDSNLEFPDLESFFISIGVLEPCENNKELCLTDSFNTDWTEAMNHQLDVGISTEVIVDEFSISNGDRYELENHDDSWRLKNQSGTVGQWPSQAALIADLGAASILYQYDDSWRKYSPRQKGQILTALRLFLRKCPDGGGSLKFAEESVESCCHSYDVIAAVCTDSGERMFERPLSEVEL